jgi:hypothetical protein
MISSPAGIDSTLLRISPCNLQAPKSQHQFYSTKSAGQMCYTYFAGKLYEYLTYYISRKKDYMMHGIKFKRTKLNSVMAQWYISWDLKTDSGFQTSVLLSGELSPDFYFSKTLTTITKGTRAVFHFKSPKSDRNFFCWGGCWDFYVYWLQF